VAGHAIRLGLLACTLTALIGCQAARTPTQRPAPPPKPSPQVSAREVSSEQVAARLGLRERWVKPGSDLVLEGTAGSLEVRMDHRESVLYGHKLFLGEPPRMSQGRVWFAGSDVDRLLRPILLGDGLQDRPPVRTVAIDAGHGGHDNGTRNPALQLVEKDLTLDVARRLSALLEARGYAVIMTRTDDTFIPLEERPRRAVGADLFISIHFNGVGKKSVTGTETYVLSKAGQASTGVSLPFDGDTSVRPGNRWDAPSAVFGFEVQRRMVAAFDTEDRGLKYARFAVLLDLPCPGS
jgi:N-acetylmuramoyl-L-alanine amidase